MDEEHRAAHVEVDDPHQVVRCHLEEAADRREGGVVDERADLEIRARFGECRSEAWVGQILGERTHLDRLLRTDSLGHLLEQGRPSGDQ